MTIEDKNQNNYSSYKEVIENIPLIINEFFPSFSIERSDYINIGYEFSSSSSTTNEVSKHIYFLIDKHISGKDFKRKDFYKIRKHFLVESFLEKNQKNDLYFNVIEIIFDSTRKVDSFSLSKSSWQESIKATLEYLKIGTFKPSNDKESVYHEERAIAYAINNFKEIGVSVEWQNGEITLNEEINKKVLNEINNKIKLLGVNFCFLIIERLKSCYYCPTQDRFHFVKISKEPMIPWGFLFNLSLKYLKEKRLPKNAAEIFSDILKLATDYCVLLEIQDYSEWAIINQTSETIFQTIQENVLRDQIYTIPQIPNKYISKIVKGIFSQVNGEEFNLPWKISDYFKVMDEILILSEKGTPFKVATEYIAEKTNLNRKGCINTIFSSFFHFPKVINRNFVEPYDIKHRDYLYKPIIKISNKYYSFASSHFFNFGFYEVIASKIRTAGLKEGMVGEYFEKLIQKEFEESGIEFLANEEYKIDKKKRSELSIKSEKGECDLILETDKSIIFIEVKKKNLTINAQSGQVFDIIFDFAHSNLKALSQATWHEIILQKYGEITFSSGKQLQLNGRKIEKVSISMFDYYSLHDNIILNEIMKNIVGAELKIDSTDPELLKKLEKINVVLKELGLQYELNELCFYKKNSPHNWFFNCHFLNLFSLFEILGHTRSTEEFEKNLTINKHITFSTRDWFREFYEVKKLKEKADIGK